MIVRFINATVTVLEENTVLDDEGDYIAEWSQTEVIEGDVQPHSMTEDEMKAYGISTSRGNIRKFFYNGIHPNVKVGNRASVLSKFTGTSELFNIMPINAWSGHGVCLLIPVENEEDADGQDGHSSTDSEDAGEDAGEGSEG